MDHAQSTEYRSLQVEIAAWEQSEAEKGQIYTRREVVEFMLSAIGLTSSDDLERVRILEPSCGEGEFALAIIDRLISLPPKRPLVEELSNKLLAIDLVSSSLETAKIKASKLLSKRGYSAVETARLLGQWFRAGDFLLEDMESNFTHVIGNPPYVRVESIPKKLLSEYRKRFSTMTDRADLYVPFYEKSLSLLKDGGRLSFICADRWTKNIYGKSLRRLISTDYSLELFIDLYEANAFEEEIMTYPAITQIVKQSGNKTVFQQGSTFSNKEASEIWSAIHGSKTDLQVRTNLVEGDKPWLLGSLDTTYLIKKLESNFPLLEEVGCKVYIGAATGANKIYIVSPDLMCPEIEKSRLVPVVTANELKTGSINWSEKYLINTYDQNGLIDLEDYPELSRYLEAHKEELSNRHVAKKDLSNWFKTIDRVYEERAKMEKLLIPDISCDPIVIYDKGEFHPNNSIYYVGSNSWNLHALRVVLLSGITKLFIQAYSTKVANGYFRFQAQHLRKIRIPNWDSLDEDLRLRLSVAGEANDTEMFAALTSEVYQFSRIDLSILGK